MGEGGNRAVVLRGHIEEIERLDEAIRALKENRKAVFSTAKADGFDARAMRQMLRERAMSAEDREEWQALCQVYRAALGMLDGTPLGEAARRRFEMRQPKPAEGEDTEAEAEGGDDGDAPEAPPAGPPAAAGPTQEDLLAARAQGAVAAKAGRKVTENPFGADDPRRAAWDEGWCAEAGSDGMDIPAAFARKSPKKGKGEGKPGEGGAGEGKGH